MQPVVLAEPDPAVTSGRPAECLTELVGERLADRIAIGQPVPRNEPVSEPERFLIGPLYQEPPSCSTVAPSCSRNSDRPVLFDTGL
jgi:hypothetical protein